MPTILAAQAQEHACPFNGFQPCVGARCMAWSWVGPTTERAITKNLADTPEGPRPTEFLPKPPPGEGWQPEGDPHLVGYDNSAKLKLPKATAQRWVRRRERTRGQCGRVQPDSPYDSEAAF